MAKMNIYEYPGELLWQGRDLQWYLDNDPQGLNKGLADALYEIRRGGRDTGDIAEVITDAYRVAVAVASTPHPKYTDIANVLFEKYHGISSLCGCVILQSQHNFPDYECIVKDIINLLEDYYRQSDFDDSYAHYQRDKEIIMDIRKANMTLDLSPDAGGLGDRSVLWLRNNIKSIEGIERVIRLYQTMEGQLVFMDAVVEQYMVYEDENDVKRLSGYFTIPRDYFEELRDNVTKGRYLREDSKGQPDNGKTDEGTQSDALGKDLESLRKEIGMLRKRCERIELYDKAKAVFNDEQRDAQELIDMLKDQLDAMNNEVITLNYEAEAYKQKIEEANADRSWFEERCTMLDTENMALRRQNDTLEKQNDKLEEKNKALESENKMLEAKKSRLEDEVKKLKENRPQTENRTFRWNERAISDYAMKFGVVSPNPANGVVSPKPANGDALRENEAYKKEIAEKEALIDDLSNKLKNKSIPMSTLIEGFKKLARFDTKEDVSMTFKSLCAMLSGCEAWKNNEEEILKIFEMDNNSAPSTINYNYGPGANHYDHHRELRIKSDDKHLLE